MILSRTENLRSCRRKRLEGQEKKKDKKKKDNKKKKKGKKSSPSFFGLGCTQNPWPQDLSSRGSSSRSSSSPEEPSSSASQAHMEDAASLYGLNKKNLMTPPDATVLDDLGARQLAYTVSFVTSSMVASDAFEIGGELVTCIDADSCACTTDTKL